MWGAIAAIAAGAGSLAAGIVLGANWSKSILVAAQAKEEAAQSVMTAAIAVQNSTEQMLRSLSTPQLQQIRKLAAKAVREAMRSRQEATSTRREVLHAVKRIHPRQSAPPRAPGSSTSPRLTRTRGPALPTSADILSGEATWGGSQRDTETVRALHTPNG